MSFVSISVKTLFVKSELEKRMDKARRKSLNRIGGTVRKIARRMIKNRKRASNSGEPPTNRTGKLKNSILYGLDDGGYSVVIGPKAFGRHKAGKTLEKGGAVYLPTLWQKKLFAPGMPGNAGGIGPVKLYAHPGPWTYPWNLELNDNSGRYEGKSINVLWRRLRSAKEAELAEENYDTLQRMRGIVPTNKKLGRVEPRPFMSTALVFAKKYIVKAWEGSLG